MKNYAEVGRVYGWALAAFVVVFVMFSLTSTAALVLRLCSNGERGFLCGNDIVVADANAGPPAGTGALFHINGDTGTQTLIASGSLLQELSGVVIEKNGASVIASDRHTGLIRVDLATGAQTLFVAAGPSDDFSAITKNADGDFLVTDSGFNPDRSINQPGKVLLINRTTGVQTVMAQGGNIVHPYGIAIDPLDGHSFFLSDMSSFQGSGAIVRVDGTTGAHRLIWGPDSGSPDIVQSAPYGCPLGIAVEPATGNILATTFRIPEVNPVYGCAEPGIFRLDRVNRTQVRMTIRGAPLVFPLNLGSDASGNMLLMDLGLQRLFRLNLSPDPNHAYANFIDLTPLSPLDPNFVAPVGLTVAQSDAEGDITVPPPLTVTINGAPPSSPEGTAVNLTSTVTGSGTLTYAWTVTKNGSNLYATGSGTSLSFTPNDNGIYGVTLSVTNANGIGTDSKTITVLNILPAVTSLMASPPAMSEGATANLTASFTDPGTLDSHVVSINWGDGSSSTIPLPAGVHSFSAGHQYLDDNPTATSFDFYAIFASVSDNLGGSPPRTTPITVRNVAPVVLGVPALVSIGTSTSVNATFTANFTDAGATDTHTCTISWDEGSPATPGVITETNGNGTCQGTHSYTGTGIHNVTVTVTDDDGGSATDADFVVVYDPTAGYVTGSGFINSPAGAYPPNPSLSGEATFGFNTRYQLNSTVPSGPTTFRFDLANLKFDGIIYEWLVIELPAAQFKGSGTINGGGNYGFILTILDGQQSGGLGIDKFRIKIWNINLDGSMGAIIYDNVMGAPDDMDPFSMRAIESGTILVSLDTAPSAVTLTVDPPVVPENGIDVSLSGAFTDPDLGDPHTVTINWGDGNSTTFNLPADSFTFTGSHRYLDDNPTGTSSDVYTITATVGDSFGRVSVPAIKPVTVNNAAPVVTGVPAVVSLGTATTVNANFTANFTDAGFTDTHTCTLSWDTGSPATPGVITETNGSGTCQGTHTYTGTGIHNVTVTVTDDDGGFGTDTESLFVTSTQPVSPISANPAQVPINQPTLVTFTVAITDPAYLPGSANLQRFNPTKNTWSVLGSFRDDGMGGDSVAGDKIFTTQISFLEPVITQIVLRASAAFRGRLLRNTSPEFHLPIVVSSGSVGPIQRQGVAIFAVADGSLPFEVWIGKDKYC